MVTCLVYWADFTNLSLQLFHISSLDDTYMN